MTPAPPLPELSRPHATVGTHGYEVLGGPLDGTEIRTMVTQVVLAVYTSATNACWIAAHVGAFPPPADRVSSLAGPVRLVGYYALVQNAKIGLTWRGFDSWAEACSTAVRSSMQVLSPHLVPAAPARRPSIYAEYPGLAIGIQPRIRLVPDTVGLCQTATSEILRVLCETFLTRQPGFFAEPDHEHILLAFRRWVEEHGWGGIPQKARDAMVRFIEALRESPYCAADAWQLLGDHDVWESIHGDPDDENTLPWEHD